MSVGAGWAIVQLLKYLLALYSKVIFAHPIFLPGGKIFGLPIQFVAVSYTPVHDEYMRGDAISAYMMIEQLFKVASFVTGSRFGRDVIFFHSAKQPIIKFQQKKMMWWD